MDIGDLERVAARVRDRAKAVGRESPLQLARALGIVVHLVANLRADGVLGRTPKGAVIGIRRSLPKLYRRHTLAHELGHWGLEEEGIPPAEHAEADCDYIGAALVMPQEEFRRELGEATLQQLAFRFTATETSAALRIGELTNEPVAVITPAKVYARGQAQWTPESIRRIAARPPIGVRAERLTDDRRRIFVDARDAARLESA